MVEKSPFLSERDHSISSQIRNEGALRSLTSLFPSAQLEVIAKIADLAKSKKLLGGKTRIRTEGRGRRSRASSLVSVAAKQVHDLIDVELSYATSQRYIDMSCDMRILQNIGQKYVTHSYGIPLQRARSWYQEQAKSSKEQMFATKVYFMDRLLFEDGHHLKATLEVIEISPWRIDSKEAGSKIRSLMYKELKTRLNQSKYPHKIQFYLRNKEKQFLRELEKSDKTLRRTALEYTVRRDWLAWLELIERDDGKASLSRKGSYLLEYLQKTPLVQEFFDSESLSVIANVFQLRNMKKKSNLQMIEDAFELLTREGSTIVETQSLINTAILINLPNFIGTRNYMLDILRLAVEKQETRLILQNGYRTRDYYVKVRP